MAVKPGRTPALLTMNERSFIFPSLCHNPSKILLIQIDVLKSLKPL
jgi:hypothetical protein